MDYIYIQKLEQRIYSLLGVGISGCSLEELSKDQCSEVSRLVGYWILREWPDANVFIMKGVSLPHGENTAHDVLLLQKNTLLILDPTIWQFFKHATTIRIAEVTSLKEARDVLAGKYGGSWELSEELDVDNAKSDMQKLHETIQQNLGESKTITASE